MEIDKIPEIDNANPFRNCKLGREKYAKILTGIVSEIKDGCVIAINGEWGTGKTTFVKMWKQLLEKEGFKTIYFNAWETDFVSDPLVGLIGELQNIKELVKGSKEWEKLLKCVPNIAKASASSITHSAAAKVGLEGGYDKAKEEVSDIRHPFHKEIECYKNDCKSIVNFKSALSGLVEKLDKEKPLVFFVDELDRCNPHYAVKVLERIKHLFDVPQIVFILSVDKEQLCNAIRGYYGSDKINAEEYLRRFIDVEYYLPEPDYENYFELIYKEYGFEDFFFSHGREIKKVDLNTAICETFQCLFSSANLPIRDVKKILAHARLAIQTYESEGNVPASVFVLLVYLRHLHPCIYKKIQNREYDTQGLVDALDNALPYFMHENFKSYAHIIVCLLLSYNNKRENVYQTSDISNPDKTTLSFHSNCINDDTYKEAIFNNYRNAYTTEGMLPSIIKHIELFVELKQRDSKERC